MAVAIIDFDNAHLLGVEQRATDAMLVFQAQRIDSDTEAPQTVRVALKLVHAVFETKPEKLPAVVQEIQVRSADGWFEVLLPEGFKCEQEVELHLRLGAGAPVVVKAAQIELLLSRKAEGAAP